MDIADALDAREGTTCVVGAGGKKTTLYALADRLDRAVVTASVRIPIFDREVADVTVTDDPVAAVADADREAWPLGLVPERERSDRYRGYDAETVGAVGVAHDGPVLVKADGARTRDFKAPSDREPQLPAGADTVVPIASVAAVGEPLDEATVHHPERVAALTDLEAGEEITPTAVATVLAAADGGLKDVPSNATVVALLNKVDDAEREALARKVADRLLARTDRVDRVVLAAMREPSVVDVVEPMGDAGGESPRNATDEEGTEP
ncbi:MAG: selenium cofactor biosynthesis protein YqeC [Halolamina sp.]